MTARKPPKFVSTLWYEPGGAARYTSCRIERPSRNRVVLRHVQRGSVQADMSLWLFKRLLGMGRIRPLAEVPTQPSLRRPKLPS